MISYLNITNGPLILIFKRTNPTEPYLLFSSNVKANEFINSLYDLSVNHKPQVSELMMDKENYDNNDIYSEEDELSNNNDIDNSLKHQSSVEK